MIWSTQRRQVFRNLSGNFKMSFCLVSDCSGLVRYLLYSIAFLYLIRKKKNLFREALSSAFTSGQFNALVSQWPTLKTTLSTLHLAKETNLFLLVRLFKVYVPGRIRLLAVTPSPHSVVRSPCFILVGPVLIANKMGRKKKCSSPSFNEIIASVSLTNCFWTLKLAAGQKWN